MALRGQETRLLTLAIGIPAALLAADAQSAIRPRRIGVLSVGYSPTSIQAHALTDGFRELGYLQGKDIVLEWRYAHGRYEPLASLAGSFAAGSM